MKKEDFNSFKNFWDTFIKSFNPFHYRKLSERFFKHSLHYLASMILVGFFIMVILSAPKIGKFQNEVVDKINQFEIFEIDFKLEQTKPFVLTENHPTIIIDVNNESREKENELILIRNNSISYGIGKLFVRDIDTSGYEDAKENSGFYSRILTAIALMMAPSILVLMFIYYIVKFFITALIIAFLMYLAAGIFRNKKGRRLPFVNVLKMSLYGITATIMIKMVTMPFNIELYYIHFIPMIIFMIIGMIDASKNSKEQNFVSI